MWTAKPLKSRVPFSAIHLGIMVVYVVAFLLHMARHPRLHQLPLWLSGLQVFLFVVLGSLYLVNEMRVRRLTDADLARMERSEGLAEYAVEVTFVTKSGTLGIDRGVAFFDQGRLGFVGGRTSFLIAAEDVVRPRNFVEAFSAVYDPLKLRTGREGDAIHIKPLIGQGRRYRRGLRVFLRKQEASRGSRQWPPLAAYNESVEATP